MKISNKKVCLLDGNWHFKFSLDGEVYYTQTPVPGNVEPTLQKLGLCGDYMPADDEFTMAKFETVDDWTYTTVFDAPELPEGYTRNLVFDGIDTFSEIYLNGQKLGETENMYMTYRYPVTLKSTGNELTVVIRSVDLWAREHPHDQFSKPQNVNGHYDSQINVRKPRYQWGWDNAPRLITSGIVRSVYIEDLPAKRFEDMYITTTELRDDIAVIGINYLYKTPARLLTNHTVRVKLMDGETVISSTDFPINFVQGMIKAGVDRSKIELWWPSGFGNAKLYDLKIEMIEDGECVADYQMRYGFRFIEIEHTDDVDEEGNGEFLFKINGQKIFIRGTSWKPLDPLTSEADKKTKSLDALREITNLHCNMVRIWGGGFYEDEVFFDYCDENGIMVWQDFMFAGEIPSTEEHYCDLVSAEAEQIVKRFRNHTSLTIWCGDNECDRCVEWVQSRSQILPSYNVITREVLRAAVLRFDPYRYYLKSSPTCSDKFHLNRHTKEKPLGQRTFYVHTKNGVIYPTDVHFYCPPSQYGKALRETLSKILSETGPIGLCAITPGEYTFKREENRIRRLWDAPRLRANTSHQNDGYFSNWRQNGINECEHFFGRNFTVDEWKEYTLAVNIICAEVFKDAIEYCRTVRWNKTGVIWWSLCDMWPMAFNYSVMDHELRPKLPYFWIEKSQQEAMLAAVRTDIDGEMSLYALNDTLSDKKFEYTVTAYDQKGTSRTLAYGNVKQEKNSSSLIQRIAQSDETELWIIKWSDGEKEYKNHAFTGNAGWNVMKRYIDIIADEFGIKDKINELK